MPQLLESGQHARRLRKLLARFRAQELAIADRLADLHHQLEAWHREASYRQICHDEVDNGSAVQRCADLQMACDEEANELVHVRMAILGAADELAQVDPRMADHRLLLRA